MSSDARRMEGVSSAPPVTRGAVGPVRLYRRGADAFPDDSLAELVRNAVGRVARSLRDIDARLEAVATDHEIGHGLYRTICLIWRVTEPLGFSAIAGLAAETEMLLDAARKQERAMDRQFIDLLHRSVALMRALNTDLAQPFDMVACPVSAPWRQVRVWKLTGEIRRFLGRAA